VTHGGIVVTEMKITTQQATRCSLNITLDTFCGGLTPDGTPYDLSRTTPRNAANKLLGRFSLPRQRANVQHLKQILNETVGFPRFFMGQNSGTRTGYSGEHQSSWENMDVHHSKLWYHRIEMV